MTVEHVQEPDGEETKQVRDREYVRTSDNIPVYYELLDEDGVHPEGGEVTGEWELLFDDLNPSPEENPKLYELLFDINQKINILINHMAGTSGFNIPEARDVNISGGGLRFNCNDSFKTGDRLILKTFLPTHAHVIKIRCEVVRSLDVGGGKHEVAVKYLDMDEPTRDKIIRYIFAKQRMMLRSDGDEER